MEDRVNPLELIETDALLTELLNRFEHAVFAGMKTKPNADTPDEPTIYEIYQKSGNSRTCQGLGHGLISWIERKYCAMKSTLDGDDW